MFNPDISTLHSGNQKTSLLRKTPARLFCIRLHGKAVILLYKQKTKRIFRRITRIIMHIQKITSYNDATSRNINYLCRN